MCGGTIATTSTLSWKLGQGRTRESGTETVDRTGPIMDGDYNEDGTNLLLRLPGKVWGLSTKTGFRAQSAVLGKTVKEAQR